MNLTIIKAKIKDLLIWSQKYTKTDMIYLTRNGFWLTAGQMASYALSFVSSIVFANFLSPETYGNYKFILSVAGLLSIFTLQGMNISITQAIARGHDGSILKALKTRILWGTVGGFSSIIVALYYFQSGNPMLALGFLIASIFIPTMDSFGIYDTLLQGKKYFKTSTTYYIFSQITAVSCIGLTVFFTKNIYLILLAYFLSWTISRAIALYATLRKSPLNNSFDQNALSYGKHLSVITSFGNLASQIDQIVLFHFLGAKQLAIYAFAIALPSQIKSITKNLTILALPKFSNKSASEIKKNLFQKMFILGVGITIIVICYIIAAPLIFKFLFPKYLASLFYSQVFSLSLIATVSVLSTTALQAKASKKELYKLNIYSTSVQLLSLVLFIYLWGIMGAIFARLLNRFVYLFLSILLVKKIKD